MTSINRLNQKTDLVDADLFPIWDSEQSRTRAISASNLKAYNVAVKDIAAGNATGEILITYTDGTQKTVTVPA